MEIDCVFFDFDGVLTTDATGSTSTCRYLSARTGRPLGRLKAAFARHNKELTLGLVSHEDVWSGQRAQIKLAAYPFQQYGLLTGRVIHVSADATEAPKQNAAANANSGTSANETPPASATYKARVRLDAQTLTNPQGGRLTLTPGMQVVAEINQGKRTVLEYLLSPVQKSVQEAGRER